MTLRKRGEEGVKRRGGRALITLRGEKRRRGKGERKAIGRIDDGDD